MGFISAASESSAGRHQRSPVAIVSEEFASPDRPFSAALFAYVRVRSAITMHCC